MRTKADGSPAVIYPKAALAPESADAFAELVRDEGARRFWMGQSLGIDPHHVFTRLSAAGRAVACGTSVTLTSLRHPYEAAIQARSVAATTGHPFVGGFGPGSPRFVSALRGARFESPLTAMREYLDIVGRLLRGEQVRTEGRYYALSAGLLPMETPGIEVGAGVLREGMARVAGETADVAITWMTPRSYVAERLVPALEEGRERAGRENGPRVATVVHVAVDRPHRDPYQLAQAGAGAHLSMGHYTDMLARAGVPADPTDPVAGARALVDHGVFVTGSPAEIAVELQRYRESGVDEVVLNCASVAFTEGEEAALTDLREILRAMGGNRGSH